MNDYAKITPHHLAVLSLSRAANALSRTKEVDPETWLFIILDLHRALYCALIAALSGSAELGAYPDKLKAKWLYYLEASRTDPGAKAPEEDYVLPFTILLSKAENGVSPVLRLTAEQQADILKLNEFRDDLDHVKPRGWSLEIGGLPRISKAAAEAFEILLPSFGHRLDETELAEAAISRLKEFGRNRPTSTPESWLPEN